MAGVTEYVSLRVPRELADQVRQLAANESENKSIILRRLLRLGLEHVARQEGGRDGRR